MAIIYTLLGVPYVAVLDPVRGVVLQKAARRKRIPSPGQMSLFGSNDPKEGDTKVENGVTYRLNQNSRWERTDKAKGTAKAKPKAVVPVVEEKRDEPTPEPMTEEAGGMAGEEVRDDDINLLESSKKNDAIKQEALKNSEYGRLYLDMMQSLDKRYERNKAAFEKRTGRKFSEYDIIAPKNVAKSKRAKNYELAKDLIQRRFNHGLPLLASKDFKPTAEGGNRDDSFHGLNSFLEKFWTRAVSTKDDFKPLFRKMQLEASNLERETQSEDTSEPEKPKYESWLEWAESPEAQAISPKAVKIGLFANSNRFNDIAYGVNQGSWSEREATNVINALVEGGYLENHKLDRWNRDKRSIATPEPTPVAAEVVVDEPKPKQRLGDRMRAIAQELRQETEAQKQYTARMLGAAAQLAQNQDNLIDEVVDMVNEDLDTPEALPEPTIGDMLAEQKAEEESGGMTDEDKWLDSPPPHDPKFRKIYGPIKRSDISYMGQNPKTGLHHIVISGETYTYEAIPGSGKNFRHLDGDNKIIARNSKTFRNKLGIPGGSGVADALGKAIHRIQLGQIR